MHFDIVTLFPEMFQGYLGQGLLNKAIEKKLVSVQLHNLRDWADKSDRHNSVDDRPFGGGPGMILMVEPVIRCVEQIQQESESTGRVIVMTPQGRKLDQTLIEDLAGGDSETTNLQTEGEFNSAPKRDKQPTTDQHFILLCGRYEGFDQRVIDILQPDEISIGDYILNGGEVAAMVMVDTLVRMVPGVLGDERSSIEDSFSRGNRMLEYPQFTRPREFRGHEVPEILLSGNHPAIAKWRAEQSLKKTRQVRADLLDGEE